MEKREGVRHGEPLNRPVFIATHSDEGFATLLAGSGLMDNRETCGFAFDWSTHGPRSASVGAGNTNEQKTYSLATYIYIHCMQSAVCLALISSRTRTPVPSTWSVLAGTASLLHVACATTHEMYICLYVCIVWHYKNVVVSLVYGTYAVACICVNTCTYGVREGCICVNVPCHLFI